MTDLSIQTARKITSRHAGIETFPSFVFPDDEARNKDFQGAVSAFYGPKPTADYSSMSSP